MSGLALEGKEVKLWTKNRFYYHGKVNNQSEEYLYLFDFKKGEEFMIAIDSISQVNVVKAE